MEIPRLLGDQGDPLSPYIFILCAEILAIQIRNNNEIQGIKVRDKEYKLTLYADDSTLLLNGSERLLKVSLEILESYSKISGLHINYSKTEVIWIGSILGVQKYFVIITIWKNKIQITRFKF